MIGRYKTIRAGETCPICGHKGWCAVKDDPEYGTIRWCHRYTGWSTSDACVTKKYSKDKIIEKHYTLVGGSSGQMFVLMPKKDGDISGGAAFMEYDTWYGRVQEDLRKFEDGNVAYAKEHGFKYKPKSSFLIDGIEKSDSNFVFEAPKAAQWKEEGIIQPLDHDTLDRVLRKWLACFTLAQCHKDKLLREWDTSKKPFLKGIFSAEEMFKVWQLKTLPPEDKVRNEAPGYWRDHTAGPTRAELISKLLVICKSEGLDTPAGIPGIYYNERTNAWDILSRSGIIFPVVDVNGKMYRFRIGVDTPDVNGELNGKKGVYRFYRDTWYFDREDKPKEEKSVVAWRYGAKDNPVTLNGKGLPPGKPSAKYVNFSSYSELRNEQTHTVMNRWKDGCQSGGCLAVYRPADEPPVAVWFTEGEKKSMVIAKIMNATVVCLPGVNSYAKAFEPVDGKMSTVDSLIAEGAACAVVAFDADKAENRMVQASEDGLVERLKKSGFKIVSVVDWHEELGKGIDDLLLVGGRVDPRVVYVEGQ